MSGGFHVHGPHDHAVEHVAHGSHEGGEHHEDKFASRIAVSTAIMAALGAYFSFEYGFTQNSALIYKNEAAIKKTEASNQWNYYQSKSSKQNMAELAVELTTGEARERNLKEIERYKGEKEKIKATAEGLEAESKAADKKSDVALHEHHRWAQAMTAIQVAISLAAITLLTRKRWMAYTAVGVTAVSIIIGGLALAHI